jgi:hypothetical protein
MLKRSMYIHTELTKEICIENIVNREIPIQQNMTGRTGQAEQNSTVVHRAGLPGQDCPDTAARTGS